MSQPGVVVLALLFGLAVGVLSTLLIRAAADRGAAALDLQASALPDGATAVVAALHEPAMVLDGSNSVVQATDGATALGLVAGRSVVHPELSQLVDAARLAHELRTAELTLRRGGSGALNLVITATAAPIDVSRVLLLIDDRSDAVRLETVRRDFVANVSHELKTPIGAVSLLAEAIDSAAADPAQVRRFAARLSTESVRLGALVQEILEFSRLQAAGPVEGAGPVPVDEIITAAVDRVRVDAEARSISLVVGKRSGVWTTGDASQLTSAVQNLVTNAVQASSAPGRVGIGARSHDGVAEITVSDQGSGIEEEEVGRIFERFYRSDQARSRHTGGTGLGLSIVKHVVENHGGEVRLWSRPGRGSTFTIRLPEVAAPVTATRSKRREKERA